jgi:hypothetical protein
MHNKFDGKIICGSCVQNWWEKFMGSVLGYLTIDWLNHWSARLSVEILKRGETRSRTLTLMSDRKRSVEGKKCPGLVHCYCYMLAFGNSQFKSRTGYALFWLIHFSRWWVFRLCRSALWNPVVHLLFSVDLELYSEDGGSMILRNIGISQPRRLNETVFTGFSWLSDF